MLNKFITGISILILFAGCAKEPGIGGNGTISGKVYAHHYNTTFTVLLNEYYVPDTYVYLVFGDNVNYGTRVKTNYKGEFEFNYLYEGTYTVYTYSVDSAAIVNFEVSPPDSAVVETVVLGSNKDAVDIGDMHIFQ